MTDKDTIRLNRMKKRLATIQDIIENPEPVFKPESYAKWRKRVQARVWGKRSLHL